jgi:hypothetical protein
MTMGKILDGIAWATATPRNIAITIAVPLLGWMAFGIVRQFVTYVAGCIQSLAHGN